MKLKINHIIICIGLLITVQLYSQENWDLKKCINYAIENNLDHYIFQLDEETAKVNSFQSKMNVLPGVSAGTDYGTRYGRYVDDNNRLVDSKSWSNSYSLSTNLTVFSGFQQINSISYYNYRKQASYWNTLKSKDDLAFSVLMAYYDIVYYRGLVKITQEQLDLSAYNLKKAEAEVSIGTKSNADLAEIQANYEFEKLNLVQAQNNLAEAEIIIAQKLNLPSDKAVSVIYDSSRIFLESATSTINDSSVYIFMDNSPQLQSSEAELNAARKNIAIQRGGFSPSISFRASLGSSFYETDTNEYGSLKPYSTQLKNHRGEYVGVSMSIPIFQRFSNMSNVKRAKINYEKATTDYQNQKLELYYQLSNDIRKWKALEVEFTQMTKQVEANELAYKAALRKYEEGLNGIIEMLTVKSRLANSKSQLLQTRLQWEIQYKLMEFYKGTRFWEI